MAASGRRLRTALLMLAGVLAATTLASCGQTGPLTLPGAADQRADGAASADDEEGREENEQR